MTLFNLSLLNCQGLASQPTKLDSFFPSSDLLIVTETKCVSLSSLPSNPSFECLGQPCHHRGRGVSGGMAVYLRRGPGRAVSLWRLGVNHMWVRVEGILPAGPALVCVVYLPPRDDNRHFDPAVFETLQREVHEAASLGSVFVVGDFNARTGVLPDLDPGVLDPSLLAGRSSNPRESGLAARRSPDTTVNNRGYQLLQFCRDASLTILNGRVPGNSEDVPTSRGSRADGRAVVDYLLTPPALLPLFTSLTVTEVPAVSDHNLLTLTWSAPADPAPPCPSACRPQFAVPPQDAMTSTTQALANALALGLPAVPDPESLPSVDDETARLHGALISVLRRRRPTCRPVAQASLPWYTRRLARLNAVTHRCSVKLRSLPPTHPARPAARQALQVARAEYRRERLNAERQWRASAAHSYVDLAHRHPKRFWSSIFDSEHVVPQASTEAVTQYFEALLNPAVSPVNIDEVAPLGSGPAPTSPAALQQLVDPFTDNEVLSALEALKTGRAADIYGLKAELIRLFVPFVSSHITPLVNRFFRIAFPSSLSTSVLIPVYKGKGDPSDPANFRGISVTPIFSKLYACLLERRLSTALDAAGLRADSQFGFRRHRGTREAAFVLRAVIESQRKEPLYCAFVDFQKAFDSVQRPLLWRLLRNLSVPEAFVRAVESYYSVVAFQVELPSGLGRSCLAGVGVKQGCPLSPVLFGVFIEALLRSYMMDTADLDLPVLGRDPGGDHCSSAWRPGYDVKLHRPSPARSQTTGTAVGTVPPLLYADDLTLLSRSPQGLQRQLDRLQSVASSYGLTINISKTKLLAVGPRAPPLHRLPPLTLADQPLEWVSEFRYLGLLLHHRKGFARAATALHASALAKYHGMIRQCRARGVEDAHSLNLLFDSLVASVLGYGAPVWAPDVFAPQRDATGALLPVDSPCEGSTALAYERLQRRFMRFVLGLPQRTPHLALQLETRRPPLALHFYKHTVKFLHHLRDTKLFPPSSLIGRALASSADYYSSSDSWLRCLRTWATTLGEPFDLESCIPSELASFFSVNAPTSSRSTRLSTVSSSTPRQPSSVPISLSSAYGHWVYAQVRPRLPLDLSSVVLSSAPTFWSRRLPSFYKQFPFLCDRSLVSRSRLYLPLRGIPLFSSSSTDLRALDPDPVIRSDLHSLAQAFSLPTTSLPALLSDPPSNFPAFLRVLLKYFNLVRNSHTPRPQLVRLVPQIVPQSP